MERVTTKRLTLMSGRTHLALAEEIADHLDVELADPQLVDFANGEIRARFADNLSGQEVDAAIALLDRMPVVLEHMDTDLLPVLSAGLTEKVSAARRPGRDLSKISVTPPAPPRDPRCPRGFAAP